MGWLSAMLSLMSYSQADRDEQNKRILAFWDEGLSINAIAPLIPLSNRIVKARLIKLGIDPEFRAPKRGSQSSDTFNNKDLLERLYVDQHLTADQIADKFGCHKNTVLNWLRKHEVEVREGGTSVSDDKANILGDKNALYQMYIIEELSTVEMGKIIGVDRVTVGRWLKKHNIQLRVPGAYLPARAADVLDDREQLVRMYETENLQEIGRSIGASDVSVGKAFKKHEIDVKPNGHRHGTSIFESELADFVEQTGLEIIRNDRSLIGPMELDVYVSSKQIALEFNGIYWHSEKFKDKNYHYDKWKACNDQGIQLIQVWEDQWLNRRPQVESMIKAKLGFSDRPRVYARKTAVQEVTTSEARTFLDDFHIQGFASGTCYVALFSEDEIVAVCVFKSKGGSKYELTRYATSCSVIGGFTKCLSYFEKLFSPSEIATFADLCLSDGSLYSSNGWTADKLLKPDYMYLYNNERQHKFGFRLKRFDKDPSLFYSEGLTERQLAELNGILRVYDAGKIRYRRNK